MQVNATLLGTCNASLASALLPVVEGVVSGLAGSGSGVLSSVTAGSCSTRIRPARARSAPANTTEATASYMFNVLATSAAGLAEDALQTALLKQLTGLQLPGWEQLLVISLGVSDVGSRDAVNLDCAGDPGPSLLPNVNWECSATTPHRGSCLASGCLPGFTASAAQLYAQCIAGQWKWSEAGGRCWPDCTGNPRGMRPAIWDCSTTPVGGLCNATACKPGFDFRGPIQARCQPRGWNVISGACTPLPCNGLPSEGGDGVSWSSCDASAPIKHSTVCNGTCPAFGAAAPANVSARCSFGQWNITGVCQQAPPALSCPTPPDKAPAVSWDCGAAAAVASGDSCVGSCVEGTGAQLAKCSNGSFTITGNCTPIALSCPTPPNKAPCVSWDCSAAAAVASGDSCVGSCVEGTGAQLAKCSNGSFTITGNCTPSTFITCPYPPSSQPGYVWSQCSSGAAGVGRVCMGSCAPGYAASDSITAFCGVAGTHTVMGACTPLPCPNPPSTGAGVSWPCSVGNTTSNTTCQGSCNRGYAGSIAATCTYGNWSVLGACQARVLTAQPDSYTINVEAGKTYTLLPDVRDNDVEPFGEPLAITISSSSTPLGATVTATATQLNYVLAGLLTFPVASARNADTFSYTVSNSRGGSATATVTVNWNRPPTATDVTVQSQDRNLPKTWPLAGCADADGDTVTLLSVGSLGPGEGTASVVGNNIKWTPAESGELVTRNGLIIIPFTVSDGRGGTATAKLTIPLIPLWTDPTIVVGGSTLGVFPNVTDGPSAPEYFSVAWDAYSVKQQTQQMSGTVALGETTGTALLDFQGSTISVGHIAGAVSDPGSFMAPGTYTTTGGGSYDLFVRKVNAVGQHVYTQTWGSISDEKYRDAVITGGYLYVLAVTTGNMPKEGLSGSSGTFSNQGGANLPNDIYLAKVNLGDGSRMWSYQFGWAGEDEPRGRKMLHVNQFTGDIFLVVTNEIKTTTLTVVKTTITTFTGGPPTRFNKKVDVWGVVLSVDPASGQGAFIVTGSAEGCTAAASGCPGGSSDGFVFRVTLGLALQFLKFIGASGVDAITDADVDNADTESIYLCGRWGNGLGGAATFLGKYTVTASKTDITEIWRTNARTEDGMLNTLCKCDPIAERVWLATSWQSAPAGFDVKSYTYGGSLTYSDPQNIEGTVLTSLHRGPGSGDISMYTVGWSQANFWILDSVPARCAGADIKCRDVLIMVYYTGGSTSFVGGDQVGTTERDDPVGALACTTPGSSC
uniref:Uncharacterized protein n=1 Tax=Tetradesmus obliquus TaxID=3088 RepID=A0A383WMZ7_TETOB|eukprot:jgi/Sobl393_1/1604/SZX78564.1